MAIRLVWATFWAVLWAAIVTTSVVAHLASIGWSVENMTSAVLAPYILGSFAGGAFGHAVACRVRNSDKPTIRFAAFFAAVACMTLCFTALFFYIPQRAYFSQWHADPLSVQWGFQALFTGLGSAYLFLVTGLRPLLPWPIIALALAAFTFSRGRFPALR